MIAEADTIDVFVVSKEDCSTYYQRKRQYQLGVHILAKKKKKKKRKRQYFPDFCTYDVRDGLY